MSCPPHRFILPPQGNSAVTIGTCACGATTGPLLNVWKSDEVELSLVQRKKISERATRQWAEKRRQKAQAKRQKEAAIT